MDAGLARVIARGGVPFDEHALAIDRVDERIPIERLSAVRHDRMQKHLELMRQRLERPRRHRAVVDLPFDALTIVGNSDAEGGGGRTRRDGSDRETNRPVFRKRPRADRTKRGCPTDHVTGERLTLAHRRQVVENGARDGSERGV